MGWTRATVYPSTSSFSGAGQLNLGPYYIPSPAALLRVEVHGKANFQGATIASNGVEANYPLWGVQWVTHGSSPQDVVSSADDEHWLLREQLGSDETRFAWEPTSSNAAYLATYSTADSWAGQIQLGFDIDLYWSLKSPTGSGVPNMNYFGTIRFWWA